VLPVFLVEFRFCNANLNVQCLNLSLSSYWMYVLSFPFVFFLHFFFVFSIFHAA